MGGVEDMEPPHGQEYVKWRLEDISRRLERTDEQVREMREDVAEVKGEVKGVAKKVTWLCGRLTDAKEELEGHQKGIALNKARLCEVEKDVGAKVDREVCRQEMGKVSMFMKVFLFMIGGLMVAAAVKIVLGLPGL